MRQPTLVQVQVSDGQAASGTRPRATTDANGIFDVSIACR